MEGTVERTSHYPTFKDVLHFISARAVETTFNWGHRVERLGTPSTSQKFHRINILLFVLQHRRIRGCQQGIFGRMATKQRMPRAPTQRWAQLPSKVREAVRRTPTCRRSSP